MSLTEGLYIDLHLSVRCSETTADKICSTACREPEADVLPVTGAAVVLLEGFAPSCRVAWSSPIACPFTDHRTTASYSSSSVTWLFLKPGCSLRQGQTRIGPQDLRTGAWASGHVVRANSSVDQGCCYRKILALSSICDWVRPE